MLLYPTEFWVVGTVLNLTTKGLLSIGCYWSSWKFRLCTLKLSFYVVQCYAFILLNRTLNMALFLFSFFLSWFSSCLGLVCWQISNVYNGIIMASVNSFCDDHDWKYWESFCTSDDITLLSSSHLSIVFRLDLDCKYAKFSDILCSLLVWICSW
jgi:hypothetical protein